MPSNYIDFVSSLVYGDLGTADLGAPPAGTKNHLNWTVDRLKTPPPMSSRGTDFLQHHLDVMLSRYQSWRSASLLTPQAPWRFVPETMGGPAISPNMFPEHGGGMPVGPTIPPNLQSFPIGWSMNDLGLAIESYYNDIRNFVDATHGGSEMDDEIKAPFSYRYWAFMKWARDLRSHFLSQTVLPVPTVYDFDGTILTEKEFCDIFHQVHHVWHPDSPGFGTDPEPNWTEPTPGFKTSVGQHRGKKEISRTQVGAEFFAFHRDHLEIFDRWLARTGQSPIPSINTCAHDTSGVTPDPDDAGWPAALNTLDTIPSPNNSIPDFFWKNFLGTGTEFPPGLGYPLVSYGAPTPTVDFSPTHTSYWDGDLAAFSNQGEMGQFFARDNNPFGFINVPGASDSGYHAIGHVINGDLIYPVANNFSPRFFAWHGYIDDIWIKREPRFLTFAPALANGTAFPDPQILTIVREFSTSSDALEPSNGVQGVDLTTGNGTLRFRVNVRPDPFNRPLELTLRCEVYREGSGSAPVITLPPRTFTMTTGAPGGASERQQGVEFIEDFVFDGSAGTVDAGGKGPFASDNLDFPPVGPSATGFLNSKIRITGTMICTRKTDGTVPTVSGTIASVGTAVTGTGTSFNAQIREGDLIRANGQVRVVARRTSNTAIQLMEPFTPDLAAGTTYERLDGFDHESVVDIPLVQEKLAPAVTVYLDRSSFSKDQVDAIAAGGTSVFDASFYVILQDRTERPAPIVWPADIEPALQGLIAPPLYAAGLFTDLAHAPTVELRDAATNASLAGQVDVTVTAAAPESPSLHPSKPQRVTYTCRVTFTGNGMFAGMVAGDTKNMKLVITATDRSGNRVTDDSARVRLQINANPYMLDGPTSWLSVDTRVFKVNQGDARFGVPAGWTNPNTFITQVINNLRAGNGTAGGESFDGLTQDQAGSVLEYSTSVNGVNVYNFALAKMRLQSATGLADVRASFRLFRWGVANVAFDDTLAYRSDPTSGIALLGRTTTNDLASIPFFAAPRVPTSVAMTTQTDATNVFTFAPTGGGESLSFYGAYLDINQSTVRFPHTFIDDGDFSSVPAGDMRSIRDLMVSEHQCMIVEIVHGDDPTEAGATPGSSDNLSQRNLMIVRTANPGTEITRTVQHSFNINLSGRCCDCGDLEHDHQDRPGHKEDAIHVAHKGHDHNSICRYSMPRPARPKARPTGHGHGGGGHVHAVVDAGDVTVSHGNGHSHNGEGHEGEHAAETNTTTLPQSLLEKLRQERFRHLASGWFAPFPALLDTMIKRVETEEEEASRWEFDMDRWKPTDGLDELVFFWNNLPTNSIVDVYLPGASVEEIINYRNLRHAPGTVRAVDSQTLRLTVGGPTYLPVPPFWGDNLAGLVTVQLPAGIKEGEKYTVDVLQLRGNAKVVLGGFQLNIQVSKALKLIDAEKRMLEIMHGRLALTPPRDRWRPILERQVRFMRERGQGFVDLANERGVEWTDPTVKQQGEKVRVILERLQILNDLDPWIKGAGEFQFGARVYSRNNDGQLKETKFPQTGELSISDKPGRNTLELDLVLFEGYVENHMAIEITGLESDTFDADDQLNPYRRIFTGSPTNWIGSFGPSDDVIDPEDLGDWKVWYRIERG